MKCNLETIMKVEGRTNNWLAEKAEVSAATISLIKQGKRLPTLPVAFRIAKALEKAVEDIWTE